MLVKLNTKICCPEGSFDKGDTVELSDSLAMGLIHADYAYIVMTETELNVSDAIMKEIVIEDLEFVEAPILVEETPVVETKKKKK